MENNKFYNQSWFLWIMLIFIAPIGIALLWFNDSHKNKFNIKTKKMLSIIFGLFFIFSMIASKFNQNDVTPNVSINNETNTENINNETDTESTINEGDLSDTEKFNLLINKNFTNPKIEESNDELYIYMDLKNNLTTSLKKSNYYTDLFNFSKEIQGNSYLNKFKSICFVAITSFMNDFGEEKPENIFITDLTIKNLNKINFNNIDKDNFEKIISKTYEHKNFR